MTPANPDALADALAEFQRLNGFHRREIEELLLDFGALVLATAEARAPQLQAEVEVLRGALDRIAHPIAAMQREVPEGHSFNGQVARSLVTAEYLQSIARTALAARAATARDGQVDGL